MSYQPFCALCAHDGKEQDQIALAAPVAAPLAAPMQTPAAAQIVPVVNQYYMAGPETSHKRKASDDGGLSSLVVDQSRKILKLEEQRERLERQLEQPPGVSRHEVRMNHLESCLDDAVMARVYAEVEVQELKNQLAGEKEETERLWSANQDLRRQVQDYESIVPQLREREKKELGMEVLGLRGKVKALEDQVKELGGDPEIDGGKREEVEVKVKKEEGSE
ncbi:hypothetical protein LTR56_013215 [Elasticomyces elasticus]|nr:hypothetical protein LTR56_013215 [Elasticomyces elasticus]KAK3650072.1 hypothetical protein LTR22_012667 [Elasticomyces elasticus]KAK4920093.1 hypothetical protein LTR49_012354 [Elasticomyces elasticus]KAK5757183.1 hypothetical protein LTS12_012699 [Elasticomyces elasticus]